MQKDFLTDVSKEYTDMYRVVLYKYPVDRNNFKTNKEKEKNKLNPIDNLNIQRSLRRSVTTISDYAKCNKFDLFVTFTFDPTKVDRYNPLSCFLKMQGWLERQRRNFEDFGYIIVPELHKDGAIHFHALIKGYEKKLKSTNVLMNNKRVYNITGFRFGFTVAQYLDEDIGKTVAYICKYITKDMVKINGQKRYWVSRNLTKPVVRQNWIFTTPLYENLDHSTVVNETDYNVIYEFKKPIFDHAPL